MPNRFLFMLHFVQNDNVIQFSFALSPFVFKASASYIMFVSFCKPVELLLIYMLLGKFCYTGCPEKTQPNYV